MVDAVVVERDALDQVDLNLVGGDDATQQVGPGKVLLLGDGDQRADGVARMTRVLGEEAVVEVQLADRGGIGIGRPDAIEAPRRRQAEERGEIGRAHVSTPDTNAHLVCRLLLEKKKNRNSTNKTTRPYRQTHTCSVQANETN